MKTLSRHARHAVIRIPDHAGRDDRAPQRIRLFKHRTPPLIATTQSAPLHVGRSERRRP
jgi:hypothetical protein